MTSIENSGATSPVPRILLGVLAAAGVALTLALAWKALFGEQLPFCAAGSSCDVVQNSRYSRVLGVPLALWGSATYAVLLGLVALPAGRRWRFGALLATAGFGMSLYLTAVSAWVIEALCPYCLVSLGLMAALSGLCWWQLSARALPGRIAAAFAAVIAAGGLHAYYLADGGSAGPEDPYLAGLAQHLAAEGAQFYGASWCPHCNQQKALFGPASQHLPYVECAPNGRGGPPATACVAAEIRNYPTWVLGANRFERVLSPKQLAYFSGYAEPPAHLASGSGVHSE